MKENEVIKTLIITNVVTFVFAAISVNWAYDAKMTSRAVSVVAESAVARADSALSKAVSAAHNTREALQLLQAPASNDIQ